MHTNPDRAARPGVLLQMSAFWRACLQLEEMDKPQHALVTGRHMAVQIFADLERPTVLPNDLPMAIPGLDAALQSLEDIMVAEQGGDESILAHTRGGTVLTFREQVRHHRTLLELMKAQG